MDKKPELLKNLPPDIKKVIFFRQFRYTAFFVIWYSAIYFGIYKYVVSSGLEKIPFQNIIIMFFILGAIPFIVFQFKKIFLESTYCGVIAEIKAVGYWGGTALVKRSVKAENTTYAKITIYLDNGKKKILILENNDGRHTTYYKKGDFVTHYRYIDIPYNANYTKNNGLVCVVCGEYYDTDREKCGRCNHTMLKRS